MKKPKRKLGDILTHQQVKRIHDMAERDKCTPTEVVKRALDAYSAKQIRAQLAADIACA
jgi:hypothetical protein